MPLNLSLDYVRARAAEALGYGWSRRLRLAVLLYGALNTVLYAGLMPLWEGFDEPFHYGFVQYLCRHHALPVQRQACLSAEIWQSLPLAPASHIVKRNLPIVTAFDEYFELPESQRLARHRLLEQMNLRSAAPDSGCLNYEAQQAPLAYALLAPLDSIWASRPLLSRVWRLRLVCALLSSLMTGLLLFRLAGLLALPEVCRLSVVFLMFSSQMFYATTAHIANDWLAVPLFTLLLCASLSLDANPTPGRVVMLALTLAAGLLTKAYFLAALPFAFGVVLRCCLRRKIGWRHAAGFAVLSLGLGAPWYLRNLFLYRDLSGMQETVGGSPVRDLARTAFHMPWLKAALETAFTSTWTGNSSATTFGANTVRWMLLLLLAATCLYLFHAFRERPPVGEWLIIAGLLSYAAGLAYSAVLLFLSSKGEGMTPAPWYVQVLMPPAMCLLLAGLGRSGKAGNIVRIAMLWLWAYVICATYVAKLIPLYGGYSGPVRLAGLVRWYAHSFDQAAGMLATTAMISPGALFLLTAAVVVSAVSLAARISAERQVAKPHVGRR